MEIIRCNFWGLNEKKNEIYERVNKEEKKIIYIFEFINFYE